MTAYPEEHVRAAALKGGALAFLAKPVSEERLISCLEGALPGRRAPTSGIDPSTARFGAPPRAFLRLSLRRAPGDPAETDLDQGTHSNGWWRRGDLDAGIGFAIHLVVALYLRAIDLRADN